MGGKQINREGGFLMVEIRRFTQNPVVGEVAMLRQQPGTSASGLRLPRSDFGQRQFNLIHFLTNHPDRLVIAWIRHWFDRFCRVTNLVAAIPNEVDSRGDLEPVEINPFGQSCGHPGERQPEQHLDWKTISGSIKIAETESIYGFAQT
jgi:hypothetical protein